MPAIAILQKGLMITAFVAVMMLLVEVLNVSTRGMLLEVLGKSRWRQYVLATGLFIAATVPDHFLEQHLWRHIFVQHVPRIFLWTFGVLAGLALLQQGVDLRAVASENPWLVMLTSAAVGLLPESGPHLAFVGMYAEGIIPISTLVANSIVQDGHGMLPLLAVSGRTFLTVKGINLAAGLLVGGVLMALGT